MGKLRKVISLAIVFTVAFAGTAVANHVYNDVPTSSVFHDEIAEIGGQACADGFPGGLFKPEDAVKRQQMARFLSRCGGRIAHVHGSVSNMIPNNLTPIAQVAFTPRANGFVLVTATGHSSTPQPANCPCQVQWRLDNNDMMFDATVNGTLGGVATESGSVYEPMSVSWVYPVTQGTGSTYSVAGVTLDANLNGYSFDADLTVTFFPFSG